MGDAEETRGRRRVDSGSSVSREACCQRDLLSGGVTQETPASAEASVPQRARQGHLISRRSFGLAVPAEASFRRGVEV